jgi:hypothetical protein
MSTQPKPAIKHILITLYVIIGIIYTFYSWIYGDTAHKGFFYNLGIGLVWPAAMFPVIGKIVGGIIIVGLVALISLS